MKSVSALDDVPTEFLVARWDLFNARVRKLGRILRRQA